MLPLSLIPKAVAADPPPGNKRLYRSVSDEEGIPVTIRADYVIGATDSERHRCDTPVDVEKRNGSENIAEEVVESVMTSIDLLRMDE